MSRRTRKDTGESALAHARARLQAMQAEPKVQVRLADTLCGRVIQAAQNGLEAPSVYPGVDWAVLEEEARSGDPALVIARVQVALDALPRKASQLVEDPVSYLTVAEAAHVLSEVCTPMGWEVSVQLPTYHSTSRDVVVVHVLAHGQPYSGMLPVVRDHAYPHMALREDPNGAVIVSLPEPPTLADYQNSRALLEWATHAPDAPAARKALVRSTSRASHNRPDSVKLTPGELQNALRMSRCGCRSRLP